MSILYVKKTLFIQLFITYISILVDNNLYNSYEQVLKGGSFIHLHTL